MSYTNKFVKKRFWAKWIFYQTSALMTTDNSVLSVHEQIFAGDIITYATSSCHNVFNFSSFQHFCKGEVCDFVAYCRSGSKTFEICTDLTAVEGTSVIIGLIGPKCNRGPICNNILNPSVIKVLSVITFGPSSACLTLLIISATFWSSYIEILT